MDTRFCGNIMMFNEAFCWAFVLETQDFLRARLKFLLKIFIKLHDIPSKICVHLLNLSLCQAIKLISHIVFQQEQLDAYEFEKQALLDRNSESQSEVSMRHKVSKLAFELLPN